MHAMSGAVQGPFEHELRPRLLLDVCAGLGAGEGRVSAVSAGGAKSEDLGAEGVIY